MRQFIANVNLLMSSLALYPYQKMRRLPTYQDNNKLLNLQLKEKYLLNSRIRKLQSEANQLQMYHSPQYKSEAKGRRFIQQSTFLPMISKKDLNYQLHSRRQSYADFFNQPTLYGTTESDYQVTNQISQCQVIIENLKKLANINKNKAEKQFFTREPKQRFSPIKPRHYDESARQASFMLSREDTEENFFNSNKTKRKSVLKKYSNIFQYTNGKTKGKQKDAIKQKEENQNSDYGEFESRVKDQSGWEEQQSNTQNIENFTDKKRQLARVSQQNGQISQFTNKNEVGAVAKKSSLQKDDDLQSEKSKDERQWKQLMKKEQQQLKKAQRRQNFLVKFLSKAKARGFELQKKISQHRIKNNTVMTTKQKQNPELQNKKQTIKESDNENSEQQDIENGIGQKNKEDLQNDKVHQNEENKVNENEENVDEKESNEQVKNEQVQKGQQKKQQQQLIEKQEEQGQQKEANLTTEQIALKVLQQNS